MEFTRKSQSKRLIVVDMTRSPKPTICACLVHATQTVILDSNPENQGSYSKKSCLVHATQTVILDSNQKIMGPTIKNLIWYT